MEIVIVGQGAIGLLWHKHLSQLVWLKQNNDDSFFAPLQITLRSSKPQELLSQKYLFTTIDGLTEPHILNYATDDHLKTADVILLTVKSYQVKHAIADITPLIKNNAIIILCHNGMGTLTDIPALIQVRHTILAMITTHGCLRKTALHAIHTGIGQCDIGLLSNKNHHKNQGKEQYTDLNFDIIDILNQAMPMVLYHDDIIEKQWIKLAINCVINPLTALNNVNNGEILQAKFKAIIHSILQEVVLVAQTQSIILTIESLIRTVNDVALATAKNSSSMRCDVTNQQKTEIDYINGYIHRLGKQNHIETPENTHLWQSISTLDNAIK